MKVGALKLFVSDSSIVVIHAREGKSHSSIVDVHPKKGGVLTLR